MMLRSNEDKINSEITKSLNISKKPMVSISWGKDSFLLLYFILKHKPDITCVHLDSGYDLPDNYKFRDLALSQYSGIAYIEIKQKHDYVDVCKKYGLPHHRTPNIQRKVVSLVKKDQMDEFAIKNGFDMVFWGLRKEESRGRAWLLSKGRVFQKNNGLKFCHPISDLTTFELWYLYEKYKLPINEIYKKTELCDKNYIRNSGWLSTDGQMFGRLDWLRYHYQEEYHKLIKLFPEALYQ